MTTDTYTHGHSAAVVRSHAGRTAEVSAAYLLPLLTPGQAVLDVGCGPATITSGLAARVSPGLVLGIDSAPAVIETARAHLADVGADNARIEVGSVYELGDESDTFDVTHAHQVLQHLSDPVAALREMRRVTRPSGIVAVRDVDYATMVHAPVQPEIDHWLDVYHRVARSNEAEPDAGRHLRAWFHAAGFADEALDITTATITYADDESVREWGETQAERVVDSDFARQAVDGGHATHGDLEAMASAWRRWARHPDAFFAYCNTQVVARV